MSSLSLRLPDFLHRKIRELAEQDHISINQFIATAVDEKGGGAADCGVSRGAWPPSGSQLVDRLLSPDVPRCTATNCPRHQASLTRRCSRRTAGGDGLRAGDLVRIEDERLSVCLRNL